MARDTAVRGISSGDIDSTMVAQQNAEQRARLRPYLRQQEERWVSRRPAVYRYARRMSCACLGEETNRLIKVTVYADDSVHLAAAAEFGRPAIERTEQASAAAYRVDYLFQLAAAELTAGTRAVTVEADSAWGFIRRVHADRWEGGLHGWLTLTVSEFRVVRVRPRGRVRSN